MRGPERAAAPVEGYFYAGHHRAARTATSLLNDAHSDENQILSQAGAQAASITNAAESARIALCDSIQSDAEAFAKLLPQYETNPDLFAQLELVQGDGRVLTNVQEKIFLPQRADGKPRELRLMLNREPPQPKHAANP